MDTVIELILSFIFILGYYHFVLRKKKEDHYSSLEEMIEKDDFLDDTSSCEITPTKYEKHPNSTQFYDYIESD